MPKPRRIDPLTHCIGLDRNLDASPQINEHDPEVPVNGLTFGVALMSENAPHGGERHPDGDEVLYLVDGRARLVFTDDPEPDVELEAGDMVVVPRGTWHRVEIIEPCHFVYLTPGLKNEVRPPSTKAGS
ncbi:MAG: cupin domain-containing protein [Woeseiaceae bacterium]|nr:cupin domain-containing protein [Woeseiaceae bacterium]